MFPCPWSLYPKVLNHLTSLLTKQGHCQAAPAPYLLQPAGPQPSPAQTTPGLGVSGADKVGPKPVSTPSSQGNSAWLPEFSRNCNSVLCSALVQHAQHVDIFHFTVSTWLPLPSLVPQTLLQGAGPQQLPIFPLVLHHGLYHTSQHLPPGGCHVLWVLHTLRLCPRQLLLPLLPGIPCSVSDTGIHKRLCVSGLPSLSRLARLPGVYAEAGQTDGEKMSEPQAWASSAPYLKAGV